MGEHPVVKNILSFKFLKIALFILSKVVIQAYALGMAVKSLMYYFVFLDDDDSELFESVQDLYYRGILKESALVTFTQATLVLPLFTLGFLFLPTVLYIFMLNIGKFYKDMRVTDIAYLFIFPVFTSLCYHKTKTKRKKERSTRLRHQSSKTRQPFQRSQSAPALSMAEKKDDQTKRPHSAIAYITVESKEATVKFSLFHSNIIYVMFVVGTTIIFTMDIAIQLEKRGWLSPITKAVLAIFTLNTILWLDFNYSRRKARVIFESFVAERLR